MTLTKNRIAARFSNSLALSRLPLLSNNIAMRTGDSARYISLIAFGWPSTTSSKSSILRFLKAAPCASSTVVGIGTRCELTRTTSSSEAALSFPDDLAAVCVITGGGGTVLIACRGRCDAGVGEGLAFVFFCLPDWECAEWMTTHDQPMVRTVTATTAA